MQVTLAPLESMGEAKAWLSVMAAVLRKVVVRAGFNFLLPWRRTMLERALQAYRPTFNDVAAKMDTAELRQETLMATGGSKIALSLKFQRISNNNNSRWVILLRTRTPMLTCSSLDIELEVR